MPFFPLKRDMSIWQSFLLITSESFPKKFTMVVYNNEVKCHIDRWIWVTLFVYSHHHVLIIYTPCINIYIHTWYINIYIHTYIPASQYWVGQKASLGFSIRWCKKIQTNILANPIVTVLTLPIHNVMKYKCTKLRLLISLLLTSWLNMPLTKELIKPSKH